MPKKRSVFRNRLEALAAGAAGTALAKMTPEAAEASGRALGRVYMRLDARRKNLACANLSRAFPDLPSAGIDELAVRVFEHFGGVAAELLHAMGHDPEDALSRIEKEGAEIARAAFASGRGVMFLTAHLGNWEWAALGTGALGIPTGVIARPLDNPLLDARLTRLRTSTGNAVIAKRDAAREMLRALRKGGAIGILNDHTRDRRTPSPLPSSASRPRRLPRSRSSRIARRPSSSRRRRFASPRRDGA